MKNQTLKRMYISIYDNMTRKMFRFFFFWYIFTDAMLWKKWNQKKKKKKKKEKFLGFYYS